MSIFKNKKNEKLISRIYSLEVKNDNAMKLIYMLGDQINAITEYLKIDLQWKYGQDEEAMATAIRMARRELKKVWRATKIKKQKNKNEI